jgi:hypothetical protein
MFSCVVICLEEVLGLNHKRLDLHTANNGQNVIERGMDFRSSPWKGSSREVCISQSVVTKA